ncbi:hypothetical protein H9L39_01159 [Fusarium oxysporum f. sp. albedinis]|nr:hypothetical protein H9L39_01159 [Fusarium oxysporum f. sp. albedinis]
MQRDTPSQGHLYWASREYRRCDGSTSRWWFVCVASRGKRTRKLVRSQNRHGSLTVLDVDEMLFEKARVNMKKQSCMRDQLQNLCTSRKKS